MVLHKDITYPVTCSICSPLFFKAQMRSDILLQEPVNFAIIFESFASMGQKIFLQNSELFKKCLPLENWKSAIAKRLIVFFMLFRTVISSFRKGVRHFCVTVTQQGASMRG